MPAEAPSTSEEKEEASRAEQERASVRAKKVTDVIKGVAVAYVGLQLGLAAVKFIGRRLRGKRPRNARPPTPQRLRSSVSAAVPQQTAAAGAAGEESWSIVDAPPPATPGGYQPIVTTVLSCCPQELYGILFSSSGTDLYLKQHRELGKQWDVAVTPWRRAAANGDAAAAEGADASDGSLLGAQSVFEWVAGQPGSGGFTRLLTFVNPKKPPSSTDTRCVQRQQLAVYRGGVLVFATAMNMLDIPFRNCFTVNSFWRVQPGPQPGTTALELQLKVHFIKRAMGVGGIISATTLRDSTAFYTAFLANVESHINQLRQQALAPLPLPLPAIAAGGAASASAVGGSQGPRQPRGAASSRRLQPSLSPFAAVSGMVGSSTPGGGAAPASQRQLQKPLPALKQIRALLVVAVLAFTLLHQLHLGRELEAMRQGGATGAAGSDGGGSGSSSSLGGLAGGMLASALGPVMTAAGSAHLVLQALLDRMGARGAGGVAPPQ